jgi:hypothetical protein
MKRVYIFVEGPTDANFIRRILPQEVLRDAEVVPSGGSSGIPSLARSVLVRRKKPIAVVMDSDSLDPDVIEDLQQSTEDLIRAADASIPVKVILTVPEIESWFFAAPEAIERILGMKVPNDLIPLGKRDPAGVLNQLAERCQQKWDTNKAIGLLKDHDVDLIRALPDVAELSKFLEKVQRDDEAA